MPKSKSSKSSMKAMKAELAALNKEYAANKERISDLQKLQTPGLSKLSNVASQHHKLPLLPGQYYKMGASGAIAGFKYPDGIDIGIKYPIARPHSSAKPRVHVVLTPKKKGGRSRKHKVKSQRRRKSSRRNH
jgi:hypothetical protein